MYSYYNGVGHGVVLKNVQVLSEYSGMTLVAAAPDPHLPASILYHTIQYTASQTLPSFITLHYRYHNVYDISV